MKITKERNEASVRIPSAAMILSGLDESKQLEFHTLDEAVVLLKSEMTASELLSAIDSLSDLTTQLIVQLVNVCGECDHSESDHSLNDVPPGLLETLSQCGVCLSSLDELLANGEIIYGA
jgi:hypothetical protein